MSYDRMSPGGSGNRNGAPGAGSGTAGGTPGKRTLTEALPPVVGKDAGGGTAGGTPGKRTLTEALPPVVGKDAGEDRGTTGLGDEPEREITVERKGRDGEGHGRAQIASRNPSDFPDHVGLTTVRFGSAQVQMTGSMRGGTASMKFKRAAMPALSFPTFIAAPAGTTVKGTEARENPAGQTKDVRVKYVVTPAIHTEIVNAETEHHDDYQRAFELTLKAGVNAVNSLLGQTFTGASQDEAVEAANQALAGLLHERLGADPATWSAVMQELVDLSPPARDANGSHTWSYTEAEVNWATNSVTRTFDSNPNVGTLSSQSLINL